MVTLELHQLDLAYASLRIADPVRGGRLEQSIAQQGQQAPVLVVEAGAGRFRLIEGYGRVEALRRLARDTVSAIVLDVPEGDALVMRHRLDHGARRSALEEGWLVTALVDGGKGQSDVAMALGKSAAWVSRRIALVRTLPEAAQDAVRQARIGPNAAEKYLVPLSRVNAAHCVLLVTGLRAVRPTLRQLGRLYAAWKAAPDDVRQQIVERPLLYLKVDDAAKAAAPDEDVTAVKDLEAVAWVCGRARKGLRDGAYVRLREERRPQFAAAWREARLAFDALVGLITEEAAHASS